MPVVVENAEIAQPGFGDPRTYTLVMTPTTGNSLLVGVIESNGTEPVGVTDNASGGSNTYVEDHATTTDFRKFYRCQTIGNVPTTITIDFSGGAFPYVAVLEVSGLAASPVGNTTSDVVGTFDATVQTSAYTTSVDGELVFSLYDYAGASGDSAGTSGTTVLQVDTNESRGFLYKVVTTAETGELNWTISAKTPTTSSVNYQPLAGGGGSQVITRLAGPGGMVGPGGLVGPGLA